MSVGRFDVAGALPAGRAAIEASAGTGKTYTLAALAARYVAEHSVDVGELLIVTFTRAAAAELRDRVRHRLATAAHALRSGDDDADEVVAVLAAADRDARADRLESAVTDFDAATITTIHGFAQQVLLSLGSGAPGDVDARLVDDSLELVTQVCADVLAVAAVETPALVDDLPTIAILTRHVRTVLGNPGIAVVPDPADDPAGGRCHALVDRAVDEVHRRRRDAGTLSFDDLLTQLRDALERSPATAAALRTRYRVALIDEFQDTDPVQWEIFSTIFGTGDGTVLVLVGDPKQAIYAFRGANVHTYLEATGTTETARSTLTTNWRSDQALLDALTPLLDGAEFGDERIGFVATAAPEHHHGRRLQTAAGAPLPAFELRAAVDGADEEKNDKGALGVEDVWRRVRDDVVHHVGELLDRAHLPAEDGGVGKPVRPGDVAVLVRTHQEASDTQLSLGRAGIPAVAHRGASVVQSEAALQWRWLLAALTRPSDPRRARTAALSWFFGWTAAQLDAASDDDLGEVQEQLYRWAGVLESAGVVDFWARVRTESGVTARVLAGADGDRNFTDLVHIAELLQLDAPGHRPGPLGLLAALALLDEARRLDPEDDRTARRIETDADAVQIMTIHAAKGLEFPVVLVPTLWRRGAAGDCVYQDPATGRRTIDVTRNGAWPDKSVGLAHKALAAEETLGENLRLLYVALTRARHGTTLWWARATNSDSTALSRILFGRDADGRLDPARLTGDPPAVPDDDVALARLAPVFAGAGDAVALTPIPAAADPDRRSGPDDLDATVDTDTLQVAVLGRELSRPHRRWSFSAISDRAHAPTVDPADDTLGDAGAADEPVAPVPDGAEAVVVEAPDDEVAPTDLPLGGLAGSAYFGSVVHELLERVDFAAPDLAVELTRGIDALRRWYPIDALGDELHAGLLAAIETPLGPRFGGRRLRDLGRGDRLDELTFELHLGTGGGPVTDRDVGALLTRHLPAGDPLRPWAERVASGMFAVELSGHLTGSIDAIFRVAEAGAEPRYVVVDYKTNVLSAPGEPPRSADYHPDRLPEAMAEHHYPLQALLYSVALHRYLRWRQPGYDPATHLGGVVYLFLRGMAGAATPTAGGVPHGVFDWSVPPALVADLSDLLDGRLVKA
jgi:exodeoxyribonuclease V beta subunit